MAIALVLEGASRKVAAESCGMDRQTLRDWVHCYNADGTEGLVNRGGGGVKPLLSEDQMTHLSRLVEAGPDPALDGVVRWRRVDLARRLEAEFNVRLHERTVGTYLARLGFRKLSVRPAHPNADPAAQTAFKKNFASIVADILPGRAHGKPLEVWFQEFAMVPPSVRGSWRTHAWASKGS